MLWPAREWPRSRVSARPPPIAMRRLDCAPFARRARRLAELPLRAALRERPARPELLAMLRNAPANVFANLLPSACTFLLIQLAVLILVELLERLGANLFFGGGPFLVIQAIVVVRVEALLDALLDMPCDRAIEPLETARPFLFIDRAIASGVKTLQRARTEFFASRGAFRFIHHAIVIGVGHFAQHLQACAGLELTPSAGRSFRPLRPALSERRSGRECGGQCQHRDHCGSHVEVS